MRKPNVLVVILILHCQRSLQGAYEIIQDGWLEERYMSGSGSGDTSTTHEKTTDITTTDGTTTDMITFPITTTAEETTTDMTTLVDVITTNGLTTGVETTTFLDTTTTEEQTTTVILTCQDICTGDGQLCVNDSLNGCLCEDGFELIAEYCVKVCPENCPGNSSCNSAEVGCECDEGYEEVDGDCNDINECEEECQGEGRKCVNSPGSYSCTCDDGYYPEGGECILEEPECPESCSLHAACKDPNRGCECIEGWEGVAGACQDVDECLTECEASTVVCSNTPGSYRCNCIEGYTRAPDGDTCVPVRCEENRVPCSNAPPGLCKGTVGFQPTLAGYQARSMEMCPPETSNEGKPLANRRCSLVGSWEIPRWLSSCGEGLKELANTTIETEAEKEEVSSNLEIITSEPEDLGTEDIETTTEVIEEVTEGENITTEVATSLVATIGNIIESPNLQESGKTDDILALLETVSSKVVFEEEEEVYKTANNNVSMVVVQTSQNQRASGGVGIIVYVRPNSSSLGFREDQLEYVRESVQAGVNDDGNKIQSTIYVPPSALNQEEKSSRVSFYIFGNTNLFPREINSTTSGDFVSGEAVVDSIVLSSTVEGKNVTNLPPNDMLLFTTLRGNSSTNDSDRCGFWNETVSDWSTRGCKLDDENTSDYAVSCKCDHLTSFATLLDANDNISEQNQELLELITIIGCSVSSFALFLVIIVFVFLEDTRKGKKFRGAYLLTSLCVALLGLNLCLIISNVESVKTSDSSCSVIAILIHFFLICTCAWMNCEATNLYFVIVKVFYAQSQLRGRTVIFYSLLWGWFMPAALVASLSLSTPVYYERMDGVCWVAEDMVIFIVVIPVFILVLYNIVIYALITFNMCSNKKSTLPNSRTTQRESHLKKFLINICIFVTLGVTWAFGFLIPAFPNNDTVTTVFAYIFTILNSLQGVLLFFLYIVRSRDVRRSILKEISQLSTSMTMTSTSEWTSSKKKKGKVKPLRYRYLGSIFYNRKARESTKTEQERMEQSSFDDL